MTSLAQKLGHLMLHNDGDRSLAFREPIGGKITKVPAPYYGHLVDKPAQVQHSANSANGVGSGKTMNYRNNRGCRLISVTCQGYISSGTYYWSWALKNTTSGEFLPLVSHGITGASAGAKTRTVSTIQGNQTRNCVVPYRGGVHNMSSQNWAVFDASDEADQSTLEFWYAADDGSGSQWYDNASQTLYVKEVLFGYGAVTGVQYDHILHGTG